MEENCFELLLAMMRLLEKEERLGSSLETAIVDVLDSFDSQLDEEQRRTIAREFIRYASKLKEREMDKELKKRINEEEYRAAVNAFEAEKMDFY